MQNNAIPEWNNSLILVNLKGRAMRVLELNEEGDTVTQERIYFQNYFGRMRDLTIAPNGDIYLATSNRDWHPRLQPFLYDTLPEGPDRIIRLQKATPAMLAQLRDIPNPVPLTEDPEPLPLLTEDWVYEATDDKLAMGERLYIIHCASCHRPDGEGIPELVPPISHSEWVTGDKGRLIQVLLQGLSEPITVRGETYEQEMPPFSVLSDEELASIITYIRQNFGNNAGAIIAGEVYEERKGI
jgi:mono/diheme cytochrome c family protein